MMNYRRILLVLSFFAAACYLLVHSSLPGNLEGFNPDGSSTITWRSFLALVFVLGLCERLADWSSRLNRALQVLLGTILAVGVSLWLFRSFQWEPHQPDGTFPLTWRTNLLILAVVAATQAIAFVALRVAHLRARSSLSSTGN